LWSSNYSPGSGKKDRTPSKASHTPDIIGRIIMTTLEGERKEDGKGAIFRIIPSETYLKNLSLLPSQHSGEGGKGELGKMGRDSRYTQQSVGETDTHLATEIA
jgi:hypothetical protein